MGVALGSMRRQWQMEAYLAGLPDSLSYPQKTQAMWQEFAGLNFSCPTPNHNLGFSLLLAGKAIELCPICARGLLSPLLY